MAKESKNGQKVRTRFKKAKGLPFLKRWRKHRNLTQERLADRAEISQGMISQLENGDSDYTGELLDKLADALRCTPADLIMRDPLDTEAVWSIWDRIPAADRARARRALEVFVPEEAA